MVAMLEDVPQSQEKCDPEKCAQSTNYSSRSLKQDAAKLLPSLCTLSQFRDGQNSWNVTTDTLTMTV